MIIYLRIRAFFTARHTPPCLAVTIDATRHSALRCRHAVAFKIDEAITMLRESVTDGAMRVMRQTSAATRYCS